VLHRDVLAFWPPHLGIAEVWIMLADNGYVSAEIGYAQAREIAEQVVRRDENVAEAHRLLGWVALNHEWDWNRAERFLRDALLLQPCEATILGANAALDMVLGRFDRAVELASRVAERDPLRPAAFTNLAYFAYTAGQFDLCEEASKKAIALDPEYPGARLTLAQLRLAQKKYAAAAQEVELEGHPLLKAVGEALVAHDTGNVEGGRFAIETLETDYSDMGAYQIANVYAYRDEPDRALEWLERAYSLRDPGLIQLKVDPLMVNLRGDPRYQAMLDRLGL
jgi:tetratricopeptide (TPR) repeat protein